MGRIGSQAWGKRCQPASRIHLTCSSALQWFESNCPKSKRLIDTYFYGAFFSCGAPKELRQIVNDAPLAVFFSFLHPHRGPANTVV